MRLLTPLHTPAQLECGLEAQTDEPDSDIMKKIKLKRDLIIFTSAEEENTWTEKSSPFLASAATAASQEEQHITNTKKQIICWHFIKNLKKKKVPDVWSNEEFEAAIVQKDWNFTKK